MKEGLSIDGACPLTVPLHVDDPGLYLSGKVPKIACLGDRLGIAEPATHDYDGNEQNRRDGERAEREIIHGRDHSSTLPLRLDALILRVLTGLSSSLCKLRHSRRA